jgi:catalase
MTDLLAQCQRDVQERMLWHVFMIHDDYGARVADRLGLDVADVRQLAPLETQVLTAAEQERLGKLGMNGDRIDASDWPKWTGSVENRQATAGEVLGG